MKRLVLVGGLSCLIACGASPSSSDPAAPPVATSSVSAAPAPKPAANTAPAPDPKTAYVPVIALSDFHGWLLPLEPKGYPRYFGGVANLAGMLQHKEKLAKGDAIILDNGDMWTGPTESTLLRGESVIQAYNEIGFTAANVANHEFDFGLEILRARVSEAKFPFLGANIVKAGTSESPDFVKPFTIVERDGVKVGVLGLSYIGTPKTTLAKHVKDLEFKGYKETLETFVPKVRAAGANAVVVLFHDDAAIAKGVLESMPDLKVAAVVAGQNHRKEQYTVRGIPIVNPGPFGRSYVRFDLAIDRVSKELTGVTHEIVDITGDVGAPPYPPSPALSAIAEAARQKATRGISERDLGRLSQPLPVGTFASSPLGNFVVDSWLTAIPDADFAMLNHGAIRQPLGKGAVTVGDLLSVMPFENNLYVVTLTGEQLASQLAIDGPIVGGMTWSYRERKDRRTVVSMIDQRGKKIRRNKKYRIVILDFMYTGGDGFQFKELDTAPIDSGLSWREPVMRTLRTAEATRREVKVRTGARARRVR